MGGSRLGEFPFNPRRLLPSLSLFGGFSERSRQANHETPDLPAFCGQLLTFFGLDVPLVSSAKQEVIDFRQGPQCDLDVSQVKAGSKRATPFDEIRWDRPRGSS